jgi:hypothetical protein
MTTLPPSPMQLRARQGQPARLLSRKGAIVLHSKVLVKLGQQIAR